MTLQLAKTLYIICALLLTAFKVSAFNSTLFAVLAVFSTLEGTREGYQFGPYALAQLQQDKGSTLFHTCNML